MVPIFGLNTTVLVFVPVTLHGTFNFILSLNTICSDRRTWRGVGGAAALPGLKNFRASTICSKIPNDKRYFNTVKNSRATVFRASASCSKILNVKSIFNTVNLEQLCLSGQVRSCSKLLISKKYIQYSEQFQGNSVFSGQAQVTQKSWTVKNFSIQCIFTWGWSV